MDLDSAEEDSDVQRRRPAGRYTHFSVPRIQFDGRSGPGTRPTSLQAILSTLSQEVSSRGHSLTRQTPPTSTNSSITQLRPQDARRSRCSNRGDPLFLPSSRDIVLALPGGRRYAQSSQSGSSRSSLVSMRLHEQHSPTRSCSTSSALSTENPLITDETRDTYEADHFMSSIIISVGHALESPEERRAREHAKKERQVSRWVQDTIPALIPAYMQLLRASQSLRSVQCGTLAQCRCSANPVRTLKVTCVYFDRESSHNCSESI